MAAAGCDDDFDAGGLGGLERGEVARGDLGVGGWSWRTKERAVEVDGDHTDWGVRHLLDSLIGGRQGLSRVSFRGG